MNIFISGGCKNGKSFFAQQEAQKLACQKNVPLYYVATMIPTDKEDRMRIARHVKEREGWGFTTIEQGTDICNTLNHVDTKGVFLLDSVTALLSNEMFGLSQGLDLKAGERVKRDLLEFAERTGNTIFVSDYIYSDALEYGELTEIYRRGLAGCDRALAGVCEGVIEVCYGNPCWFKHPFQENHAGGGVRHSGRSKTVSTGKR